VLNLLAILPGIVLFVYYAAVLLINSGVYNTWSREVVPLTERLSDVFPQLLPWNSLLRFKVRPDIVFPYMDPQNDFVYFPERMLMYNNVWNLNLISRAVGEALQMRSSFWHVYYKAKPVLRWIFWWVSFARSFLVPLRFCIFSRCWVSSLITQVIYSQQML